MAVQKLMNRMVAKLPATLELTTCDNLPLLFHEIGITHGYRKPGGKPWQYIWSAVAPFNNETINIWTHFVPFCYNLFYLVSFLLDFSFSRDPYHWPFLVFLFSTLIWPLVSCLAHVFGAMSVRARHLCFLSDYCALSLYSFGAGLAYHAYSFDRNFFALSLSSLFPYLAALSAVFCSLLSSYSRIMPKCYFWRRKIARSAAFFFPYVFVNFPLAYRLWWHWTHDTNSMSDAVTLHLKQFASIAIAFALYNLHTPERWYPGRFDYVGHSHQIFHVFGAAATYFQMWAVRADMESLRHVQTRRVDTLDLALFAVVFVVNVAVMMIVLRIVASDKVVHDQSDTRNKAE